MLREFILISANLGTRPVSELMNISRDAEKTLFKNWHTEQRILPVDWQRLYQQ